MPHSTARDFVFFGNKTKVIKSVLFEHIERVTQMWILA
jgi:hypothetical protein